MLSQASVSKMRLWSGLIIFAYIILHFGNHALGLISLDVMSSTGQWMESFIRFPPVSILLYAAIIVHMLAALWKVFTRRSLRMPVRDWVQLILGLAIPVFIMPHIIATRAAAEIYGVNDSYFYVLFATFVASPISAITNAAGLISAWGHGCLGLHMWLRTKAGYSQSWRNIGLVVATLYPAAALTGYLSAGREIAILAKSGEWLEEFYASLNLSSDAVWDSISADTQLVGYILFGLFAAMVLARWMRNLLAQRAEFVTIDYLDGPMVKQPLGHTLLEMSRNSGVPHASVCGGRGRCSTCRVQVLESVESPAPASETELLVLERVQAKPDVRLACQMVPQSNMRVMRILPSDTTMLNTAANEPWATGQEQVVAVLFADIRDFTKTSEARLPFDVVYLINQFSQVMGQAVERNNGRIDKFLGDGLMAIFGINSSPQEAAQNALAAASDMRIQLDLLNERLKGDLKSPMRMGIGIHTGPVVLGNMGYGASRGLTAIGDTVNTASRLESETKAQKCDVCVSAITAERAGITIAAALKRHITIRGKRTKLDIYALNETAIHAFGQAEEMKQ